MIKEIGYGWLFFLPVQAFALFGAGDSVVVVGDLPGIERHAEQMVQWADQISKSVEIIQKTTRLVEQTDQLLSIVGNPGSVIESVSSLNGATQQLHQIFNTQTTQNLRNIVRDQQSLQQSTNKFRKTIDDSVLIGGKKQKRQPSLYDSYALLEGLHDNFEAIVGHDRKVQQSELKRQEQLHKDLIHAQTEWDREQIKAAITASKALQDASSQSVAKAQQAYQTETLAMDIEHQKQALAQWEEKRLKKVHRDEQVATTNDNLKRQIDHHVIATAPHQTTLRIP